MGWLGERKDILEKINLIINEMRANLNIAYSPWLLPATLPNAGDQYGRE